jgi:hypothetical protein
MVLGSILNWAVGRTLDFTFDTIWWITSNTGQGIYNAGYYLIISRKNKDSIENDAYLLINEIKEQNKLLKEEIIILKQLQQKDSECLTNSEVNNEKDNIEKEKENNDNDNEISESKL